MSPKPFKLKAQRRAEDIGISDLEIYRAGDARAWAVLPIPLQDHEQPGYSSLVQGPAYWVVTSPNVFTPMGIPEPPRYRRKGPGISGFGMLDAIVGKGSVAWSLSSQGFKILSASERQAMQEAVVDETSRYLVEREEIRRRRLLDSTQPTVTDVKNLNISLTQPFIPLGKKVAEVRNLIANPTPAPTLPFEGSSSCIVICIVYLET
ncbi:hypothetical protein FISHEDRAFT_74461 [Fistulina hepatica ATCC 64428]|uniref:Uncharacterized protein n=1 Tax=Fistulina hepatica ATCC 64428 TaxID=1128425 RepID=A0A0D7AB68_9AGAR|nr:hypothetical protein FISHEDRAFT_74461 [Fistulina hepatica ATCC 64428]